MTNPTRPSDTLKEIEREFEKEFTWNETRKVYICKSSNDVASIGDLTGFLRAACIRFSETCVPEERIGADQESGGWNDCRDEILKNAMTHTIPPLPTKPRWEEEFEKSPRCGKLYLDDDLKYFISNLLDQREKEVDIEKRLPEHKASLHITHNENTTNYETVEQYIKDMEERDLALDWATPTSRQRAIETNSLWELQWYPNTPIGFNIVFGATLEEILASLTSEKNRLTND